MASIKTIAQASGYIAAYAGSTPEEDRVEPVICWSVLQFDDDDDPDEVVGQIFNGQCITEATAVDEEEGYGEFVGYFKESKAGLEIARGMCDAYREKLSHLNGDDEEGEDEEDEDEVVEDVDGDEDDSESEDDEESDEDEDDDDDDWDDLEDEDDDDD